MGSVTSEAYDQCLWFSEFDEYDDEHGDDDVGRDADADEDDAELTYRPKAVDFRPSPVCAFAPRVSMVAERYRDEASELLNIYRGAVDDGPWLDLPLHIPLPPRPPSPRERIWRANLLADRDDVAAVHDDLRAYRADLPPALGEMTGEEAREDFLHLAHHLNDWRLLVCLAGCRHDLVIREWWWGELAAIDSNPARLAFLRARDVMRRRDPVERELARARDAKRRKTRKRQAYLASAPVREKEAARLRALRAAATPEQKAAEAKRKREARARKSRP